MKEARYAAAAARLLKRLRPEPSPTLPLDRRRLVASVEHALHARARRRKAFRWAAGASAAAAVVLAAGLVTWRRVPASTTTAVARPDRSSLSVMTARGGSATTGTLGEKAVPLLEGTVVAEGTRLTASVSAEVQVGAPNGTALTLERGGDLSVDEASSTQRFTLRVGAMRAHVAHLLGGQRFIVDTGDAEVEVHGTTFRVAVVTADPRCGGGTETRVSVFEGIVTVRSAGGVARVPGGTEWPTGCVPASARPAPRPSFHTERRRDEHVPLAERPAGAVVAAATLPPVTTPALPGVVSPLSTENDLFAAAVRARRQGRPEEAAAAWTHLIEAYPQGPLVESAMAQRMKVLASIDPARAASAAREYLARFPSGFAREDAQRLSERLPRDR